MKLADPGSNHLRLSDRITRWVKWGFLKSEKCSVVTKRWLLSRWLFMIEMEITKEPNRDRDWREEAAKEAETEACCPCHVSLCVCVHHVSALLWSLAHFIHYSQLSIDWEQGTYHRPARGRERWKGPNVQPDRQEGRMAKRINVHHGCVCRCSCVRARSLPCCACSSEPGVLMCDSQYSAAVPVEHICLNHWYWYTSINIHDLPTECCLCSTL